MAACSSGAPAAGASEPEARTTSLAQDRRPEIAHAGSEIGLPTNGTTPAPFYRGPVSVASNGSGYLAVWDDERDIDGTDRILGQLFYPSGAPVSTIPLVVATDGEPFEASASVGWDGKNYVVSWIASDGASVEATRIAADGTPVDASPATILKDPLVSNLGPTGCRSDGGCLLVVVDQETDGTLDLTGAFMNALVPGASIVVSNRPGSQSSPSVAVDANGFTVVFDDLAVGASARDVYGQRVSAQGALVGTNFGIATTTDDEGEPAAVSTGGGSDLVAWMDDNTTVAQVQSQLWPATGTTTSSPIIVVPNDSSHVVVIGPEAVLTGSEISVFFQVADSTGGIELAEGKVSTAGALDEAAVLVGSAMSGGFLAAASNGTGALAIGTNQPNANSSEVYAQSFSGQDAGASVTLTNAPPSQRNTVVASNQRDYLLAYAEYDGAWATHTAILTSAGQVAIVGALDPSQFRYAKAKADSDGNYLLATLTGDGTIPWTVSAYRVTDGPGQPPALGAAIAVRNEAVMGPSDTGGAIDLACGKGDCLVAWTEAQTAATDDAGADAGAATFAIYAALVENGGTVGTPVAISTTQGGDPTQPTVAFDGAKYIVEYERAGKVLVRTFTSGTLGSEVTIASAPATDTVAGLAIACRGTDDCAAAWAEYPATGSFVNVAHVGAQGDAGAPFRIDPGPAEQPSMTFDGTRYLVAWDTGTTTGPNGADVYLTEVSADGASVVARTAIAASPSDEYFGAVTSASPGTAVVAYTRMVDDPEVLITRAFARFVTNADDDGGAPDAGPDATPDSGPISSPEGGPTPEAGADAGPDSGPGPTTIMDAGPDAPVNGGNDAGRDAAPPSIEDGGAACSVTTTSSPGCGCRVGAEGKTSSSPFAVLFGLAALAAPRLRRRRTGK